VVAPTGIAAAQRAEALPTGQAVATMNPAAEIGHREDLNVPEDSAG
jgi:hypothetical protein